MKHFLLVMATVFLFFSCQKSNDFSIGEKKSAADFFIKKEIIDSLHIAWNAALVNDSILSNVKEVRIIKDGDVKSKKEYFGILGTTVNDSAKIMCEIELKDDKFYFIKSDMSTLIICSGSKKCNPKRSSGSWYCDNGADVASCAVNCRKSIISTITD